MTHWLKALGHARWSLPDAWLEDERGLARLHRTGFPRRPRMEPGDRLVYYASGWKRVFAVVEVTEPPTDAHPVSAPLAVDGGGRGARGRPAAGERAAGGGARHPAAIDVPAVAHPDHARAIRARGGGHRQHRQLASGGW